MRPRHVQWHVFDLGATGFETVPVISGTMRHVASSAGGIFLVGPVGVVASVISRASTVGCFSLTSIMQGTARFLGTQPVTVVELC